MSKVSLICGKKGSGKSYLVKKMLIPESGNLLIYDFNREYHEFTSNYKIVNNPDKLEKSFLPFTDTRIIFQPLEISDTVKNSFFSFIHTFKNSTIIIDEAHLLVNQYSFLSKLVTICRLARHYKINLILVTQRITDIPQTIVSNSDKLYIFNHTSTRDVRLINDFYDIEPDKVKRLKKFQFLRVST